MNILAIDTSGPACGVAVLCGQKLTYESVAVNRLTHSVNLMPMIDAALSASSMTLKEINKLAVVTGPGSFTGVRIGVSTAKGLAHGSGIPCVAVDALQALAAGVPYFDGAVCPIQDARAGQVYGAAFRCQDPLPERLMPDTPMALSDYLAYISELGERLLFLGDGMPVHREAIASILGGRACFAEPQHALLRPGSVAVIASHTDNVLDYLSLMPMYLRAPSAERNRRLMEAMDHAR